MTNIVKLYEEAANTAMELQMTICELIENGELCGYFKLESLNNLVDEIGDFGYGCAMEAEARKNEIEELRAKIRKLERGY